MLWPLLLRRDVCRQYRTISSPDGVHRWSGAFGKAGLKVGGLAVLVGVLAPIMDNIYKYENGR